MINGNTVLAIIPARGGSKRLPNKNILDFAGKPLIVWTIETGFKSEYIDEVFVTSDSDKIIDIAKKNGANIIKRPQELATDEASSFSVIEHALNEIDIDYNFTILLQPTSPLRNNRHVDEAFELLIKQKADAVISVSEMDHSPLWSNILPPDGSMDRFLNNDVLNIRSQDLEKYYRLNGAIYICTTGRLLEEKTFFIKDNIYAYKMDQYESVDIDKEIDFQYAKFLIENLHTNYRKN